MHPMHVDGVCSIIVCGIIFCLTDDIELRMKLISAKVQFHVEFSIGGFGPGSLLTISMMHFSRERFCHDLSQL